MTREVACNARAASSTLHSRTVSEERDAMTVGEIISTGRKRAGLTLRELAEQVVKEDGAPISLTYLNDVEHDRRPAPSPALLRQLADVLHLSYDYLMFVAGDIPDDLREGTYTPEDVEAAFQAFRTTLHERSRSSR